jgi:hypothetical protein
MQQPLPRANNFSQFLFSIQTSPWIGKFQFHLSSFNYFKSTKYFFYIKHQLNANFFPDTMKIRCKASWSKPSDPIMDQTNIKRMKKKTWPNKKIKKMPHENKQRNWKFYIKYHISIVISTIEKVITFFMF